MTTPETRKATCGLQGGTAPSPVSLDPPSPQMETPSLLRETQPPRRPRNGPTDAWCPPSPPHAGRPAAAAHGFPPVHRYDGPYTDWFPELPFAPCPRFPPRYTVDFHPSP
ncbi:hypothetical protein Bbelb_290980 [Branchiostoma belcheri]|nr:hypothetical protein Bbelb_290980 [Branchiostoma belcheri]